VKSVVFRFSPILSPFPFFSASPRSPREIRCFPFSPNPPAISVFLCVLGGLCGEVLICQSFPFFPNPPAVSVFLCVLCISAVQSVSVFLRGEILFLLLDPAPSQW
jgi:hypothetical protein